MYEATTIELDRTPIAASDADRALFAEEFLVAVSRGWDDVIRLLESREPGPEIRRTLEALLDE